MDNLGSTKDPYRYDYFTIKKYNDDYYRIVYHKCKVMKPGYEERITKPSVVFDETLINDSDRENKDVLALLDKENEINRLANSLSRSRSKIFEYSLCNKFDFFVTLTLNKEKYDRYDLKKYIKDLGQYFRNLRRKYKTGIEYLLIPEMHSDGAWHIHGLIKGVPFEEFRPLTLDEKLPDRLRKHIENGRNIMTWNNYVKRFGWCTFESVHNQLAISKYITKYITKGLGEGLEKGNKIYYSTRGLKVAEKIRSGSLDLNVHKKIIWDFENDYVNILSLNKEKYNELVAMMGLD